MASKHSRGTQGSILSIFDGLDSFAALEARLAILSSNQDRGDAFEVFAEAYLATQRITEADEVWPFNSIPLQEKKSLGLDTRRDMGVDGLYRTKSGEHRAYQVKFRSGRPRLAWEELSTFMGLSDRVSMRVLFTNCDALPDLMSERTGFFVIRGSDLDRLTKDDLDSIRNWLSDKPQPPTRYTPKEHQQECLEAIDKTLASNKRTTAVMACGTGKTLVALWAAERSNATRILVLVPSLALVRQILHEWLSQTSWENLSYLCVCSDSTVVKGNDSLVVHQADLDFPVTTDPESVRRFLSRDTKGVKVVFSTYQSASVVADGMDEPFELGIFDEAHKTAGRGGTRFSFALDDANLAINKRLFFTATPRHYDIRSRDKEGDARLVYSMDDENIYGPKAHVLPFAEAARRGIICDYKVVISVVTSQMIDEYLLRHGEVVIEGEEVKAQQVAVQIALQRAVNDFGVKKIFSFHGSVKAAKSFTSSGAEGIATHLPGFGSYHVSGEMPTSIREEYMRAFRDNQMAVMSNARCLTEGVDVPAVDMVAFMSPRKSKVDIIQATGRAMRKSAGKAVGYVLVPIFLEQAENESVEEAVERTRFDDVWEVLAAMREQDQELAEIISQLREERGRSGGYDERRLRERVEVIGPVISLEVIRSSITAQCLDRLGRSWDEWFGLFLRWREQFGKSVPEVSEVYRDYKLGIWASTQRSNYIRGWLSPREIKKLESLDGWTWDLVDDSWKRGLACLQVYWECHKTTLVPDRYIDTATGLKLGQWVKTRRLDYKRGILHQQKIMELEKFPDWSWDPNGDAWKRKFNQLKELLKIYTLEEIERSRRSKASSELVTIASWIVGQKSRYLAWKTPGNSAQKYRRQLSLEEIAALESLRGWSWDRKEDRWRNKFELLKLYLDDHLLEDLKPETLYRGVALGRWNTKQRAAYKKGALESWKLDLLIGVCWDPDPFATAWEQAFALLEAYVKEFKTGYVAQATVYRGFKLGRWVSSQRSAARAHKLTPERHSRLAQIPGWSWDAASQSASGISKRGLSPSKLKAINT